MDVHRLSYGCPSVFKLTVSFYINFNYYLSGRPSAFIWTSINSNLDVCLHLKSISTSEAIHQFSSRHPSSLWSSISYQTDVHKNLCGRPSVSYGRPSVFKLTSVSFHIDVHHYLSDVHQLSCGRPSVPLWPSISSHRDMHKNLFGVPSASIRTSIRTFIDIRQFL